MGRFCFDEQNKKKSPNGIPVKLDFQKNNVFATRKPNSTKIYPYRSDNSILKNNNPKNYIPQSSRTIDIDIEKNQLRRIKHGKVRIEGKIDLHGLTLKEAEKKLKLFVGDSFRHKRRFILVITGKGKNSKPNIYGEIKTINSEITRWFSDIFYLDKVQYTSKALDKHGGAGAYYLFLKKL